MMSSKFVAKRINTLKTIINKIVDSSQIEIVGFNILRSLYALSLCAWGYKHSTTYNRILNVQLEINDCTLWALIRDLLLKSSNEDFFGRWCSSIVPIPSSDSRRYNNTRLFDDHSLENCVKFVNERLWSL